MPPNQQNQYDFILNANTKPRRSMNFGNSPGARIALVLGALVILIILVVVVNSLLGSGDKAQTQRLTEVAQAQSEIIRVSALGDRKAKSADTQILALNTKLSVQSSRQEVKKSLEARGIKQKNLNKQLNVAKNTKTDTTLEEATKNNRFDETFVALLTKQLTDYQKLLKNASSSASPKEKKVLTTASDNVTKLNPAKTASNETSRPRNNSADESEISEDEEVIEDEFSESNL